MQTLTGSLKHSCVCQSTYHLLIVNKIIDVEKVCPPVGFAVFGILDHPWEQRTGGEVRVEAGESHEDDHVDRGQPAKQS